MGELSDRVAVVTGGAHGIGRAVGGSLARAGARVGLVDCDGDAALTAARAIEEAGGEAVAWTADVSDGQQVEAVVSEVLSRWRKIDVLVNNAGVEGVIAPVAVYPDDIFDRVLAVNVRGVFLGMKHVLPSMMERGAGSVINLSSVGGVVGSPGFAAYVASKHAVIGLTRVAAVEAGAAGVRVNALCPGAVDTRMMRSIEAMAMPDDPAAARRSFEEMTPLGRYATAGEVAAAVLFLASDASAFATGSVWTLDGGLTAH